MTIPIPIPIPRLNFEARRFGLRGLLLLWAGAGLLPAPARADEVALGERLVTTEPLMLGSPTEGVATRTVTITIAYKPTLAPGIGDYTLAGCYGEPSGGHIFGPDGTFAVLEGLPGDNFTIGDCLQGCADSAPEDDAVESYAHAGIKDGRYVRYICSCHGLISRSAAYPGVVTLVP